MGESEKIVMIKLSPSSSDKDGSVLSSSDGCIEEIEEGTPMRPIFCLKKNTDMKRFEEIEDCFILDFDPFDITKLSVSDHPIHDDADANNDLSVVAEKGHVACRDYPHSRHLCLKFPFDTTLHHNHCELCYCYVCDSIAPCKHWTDPKSAHCHASDRVADWKSQRNLRKNQPVPP